MSFIGVANLLAQIIVGRQPDWSEIPLLVNGSGHSFKGAPHEPGSGVGTQNTAAMRVIVDLRRDAARFGSYVVVDDLDATSDYTIQINDLEYVAEPTALTTGNLTFAATGSLITRASGSWISDGVTAGSQVYAATALNTGTYTVVSVNSAAEIAVVEAVVNETATPSSVLIPVGGIVTASAIYTALAALINTGVPLTTGDLTFAATGNTITRASGNWTTDGIGVGSQIIVAGVALNEGTWTVLTVDSATQITVIPQQTVVNETGTPTSVLAREQVKATAGDDLEIQTLLGEDQSEDGVLIFVLANNATTHTTVVTASTSGISFTQDATTANIKIWAPARGTNAPSGWRVPNDLEFETLGRICFDERFDFAGTSRIDVSISDTDGIVRAFVGPAVREGL